MVDHSAINRWVIRLLLLEKVFRKHKHAVGTSWRMDETYIKVKGVWKYLYRAVDKQGKTVDFLLTAKRDAAAARRLFEKAMRHNAVPDKVTMDKSGADQAALEQLTKEGEIPITIRQVKYLNNVVEQDHRAIKRITRRMLDFKSFRAARYLGWYRVNADDSKGPVQAGKQRRPFVCRPVLRIGRTSPFGVRVGDETR